MIKYTRNKKHYHSYPSYIIEIKPETLRMGRSIVASAALNIREVILALGWMTNCVCGRKELSVVHETEAKIVPYQSNRRRLLLQVEKYGNVPKLQWGLLSRLRQARAGRDRAAVGRAAWCCERGQDMRVEGILQWLLSRVDTDMPRAFIDMLLPCTGF